jgi:HD superfamily phosphohydrolase
VKFYEIRDPVYGFIGLNELEMDIVNHSVFQRLRRIQQLGFTEMVYPSAKHNRFEHSLGVMHLSTRLYDEIVKKNSHILKETIGLDEDELNRDRELIRLAALLHDIGHTPFSHVGENIMPINPKTSKSYKHEHYSAVIIKKIFKGIIEDHEASVYNIKAKDVAALIEGDEEILKTRFFWKVLISGTIPQRYKIGNEKRSLL